jgi:hypothetical protein
MKSIQRGCLLGRRKGGRDNLQYHKIIKMKKIILGFLIGVIGTLLILNHFPWYKLISLNVLKAAFAVFLALLGGLVALYQKRELNGLKNLKKI